MIRARYYDLITKPNIPKNQKSGDEIVVEFVARSGLELV